MEFTRYIGIAWQAGGRSFDGADCWGLVCLFYKHELGIGLDGYNDAYDPSCRASELGVLISAGCTRWHEAADPRPGDVAVLKRAGHPSHVGIIAPRRHLLHVESAEAPSILQRVDGAMKRRMVGVYRWRQ